MQNIYLFRDKYLIFNIFPIIIRGLRKKLLAYVISFYDLYNKILWYLHRCIDTHIKKFILKKHNVISVIRTNITYKRRHIKKVSFLVVGPQKFYPPYHNGFVVHATFFFFLFWVLYLIVWNGFWQFFFFPIFGLKQPDFREKNGPTTKS